MTQNAINTAEEIIRDPNHVLPVTPIDRLYSDWSDEPTEEAQPTQERSAEDVVKTLEYLTDELTSALNVAQRLCTDFGLEVENAELDGLTPTAEFDESERKQLRSIAIRTRQALKLVAELITDE